MAYSMIYSGFMKHTVVLTSLAAFFIITIQAIEPILLLVSYFPREVLLARHEFSLKDRNGNAMVNQVFKDNILLNLAYLSGKVRNAYDIDWNIIEKPSYYEFTLNPGQTFAFHDSILSEFRNNVVKTSNAHFNSEEGFKSDGYLVGDGVCHLASLINWAAQDAKLTTDAPTNHNFAVIPEIPAQYGVAIYNAPDEETVNEQQNLYIKNSYNIPINIEFRYANNKLSVGIYKVI